MEIKREPLKLNLLTLDGANKVFLETALVGICDNRLFRIDNFYKNVDGYIMAQCNYEGFTKDINYNNIVYFSVDNEILKESVKKLFEETEKGAPEFYLEIEGTLYELNNYNEIMNLAYDDSYEITDMNLRDDMTSLNDIIEANGITTLMQLKNCMQDICTEVNKVLDEYDVVNHEYINEFYESIIDTIGADCIQEEFTLYNSNDTEEALSDYLYHLDNNIEKYLDFLDVEGYAKYENIAYEKVYLRLDYEETATYHLIY